MGGKRVSRGNNFSLSAPDIEHPVFSVECKYRAKLSGFLTEGLAQARKYSATKTPVLVLKERGKHGALVVMSLEDFVQHLGGLDGATGVTDAGSE